MELRTPGILNIAEEKDVSLDAERKKQLLNLLLKSNKEKLPVGVTGAPCGILAPEKQRD